MLTGPSSHVGRVCSSGVHGARGEPVRADRNNWLTDTYDDEERCVMSVIDHFYLVEVGHGRWVVRHQITDMFAGSLLRTTGGFRLKNEQGRTLGNFATIDDALRGLYQTA